jgi:Ca2+-binding EF-hand superfamily protein
MTSCREEGLRSAFDAMDTNRDGFITLAEFQQLMTRFKVQCSAVQCSAVQCSAVQCSAPQYRDELG